MKTQNYKSFITLYIHCIHIFALDTCHWNPHWKSFPLIDYMLNFEIDLQSYYVFKFLIELDKKILEIACVQWLGWTMLLFIAILTTSVFHQSPLKLSLCWYYNRSDQLDVPNEMVYSTFTESVKVCRIWKLDLNIKLIHVNSNKYIHII